MNTPRRSYKTNLAIAFCLSFTVSMAALAIFFARGGGLLEDGYETAKSRIGQLKLPPGFKISMYARVPCARQMAIADGLMYVGARQNDKVHVVADSDGDHVADSITALTGFNCPNGVAVKDGDLYIGEVDRVRRIQKIKDVYLKNPVAETYKDGLPTSTHHGWKYLRFSPHGELYTAQGMPCNVCEKSDPIYGSILRLDKDKNWQVYASGVRNSVGFDWQPGTGDLWFTDNGRDHLGDDLPPDELNHAPRAGMFFGFPYRYGDNQPDPEYGGKMPTGRDATVPVRQLGPHVASLGMRFCASSKFPEQYKNSVFIAEHGSWNRSRPIGYRVMRVDLSKNPPTYEPFISGWQNADGSPWGRPVDIVFDGDAMYVSDDFAGAIYRVTCGD